MRGMCYVMLEMIDHELTQSPLNTQMLAAVEQNKQQKLNNSPLIHASTPTFAHLSLSRVPDKPSKPNNNHSNNNNNNTQQSSADSGDINNNHIVFNNGDFVMCHGSAPCFAKVCVSTRCVCM